jgi:hypothetical protein
MNIFVSSSQKKKKTQTRRNKRRVKYTFRRGSMCERSGLFAYRASESNRKQAQKNVEEFSGNFYCANFTYEPKSFNNASRQYEEGEPTLRRKESCQTYYFTQMVNDLLISISKKVFCIFVVSSRHLTQQQQRFQELIKLNDVDSQEIVLHKCGVLTWFVYPHIFRLYWLIKIFAKYCGFNIRSLPSPMVHTSKDPSALETLGSVGDVMYSHRRPHFFFLPGKITVAVTLAMYFSV